MTQLKSNTGAPGGISILTSFLFVAFILVHNLYRTVPYGFVFIIYFIVRVVFQLFYGTFFIFNIVGQNNGRGGNGLAHLRG